MGQLFNKITCLISQFVPIVHSDGQMPQFESLTEKG